MPSIDAMKNRLQSAWQTPMVPFLTIYVLTGLLVLLVPAIKHRHSVNAYRSSYYYQYQQQNENQSQDRQWTDVNNCKWYQWNCESLWVNENGEYANQNNSQDQNRQYYNVPNWWGGGGYGSGDRRSADGGYSNSAGLKFVYAWQTILFLGMILGGGSYMLYTRNRNVIQALLLMVFLWMNMSFMAIWLLANGSIYANGREMEDIGGFYNQFSVMMFLTNVWYTVWSVVVCIALVVKLRSMNKQDFESGKLPQDSMNYLPYSERSNPETGVSTNKLPTEQSNGGFSLF